MIVSTIIPKGGSLFIEGVENRTWRGRFEGIMMWNGVPITLLMFYGMLGSNILCEMVVLLVLFQYFVFFFLEVRIFTHIRVIVTPKWVMNCDMKMGYIEVKNL
jgi:hypothetical protein